MQENVGRALALRGFGLFCLFNFNIQLKTSWFEYVKDIIQQTDRLNQYLQINSYIFIFNSQNSDMNIDVKLCQFIRKLSLWIAHKNVIHKTIKVEKQEKSSIILI